MPIMHIVWMKLNEGVTDADCITIAKGIMSMNKLDTVISCNAGKNFSTRSKGYDFALTVICNNKADLDEYAVDPYHQEVKDKYIFPYASKEDIMAIDYEY
eukprot:CFRG0217T1